MAVDDRRRTVYCIGVQHDIVVPVVVHISRSARAIPRTNAWRAAEYTKTQRAVGHAAQRHISESWRGPAAEYYIHNTAVSSAGVCGSVSTDDHVVKSVTVDIPRAGCGPAGQIVCVSANDVETGRTRGEAQQVDVGKTAAVA